MMDTRKRLFDNYQDTHSRFVNGPNRLEWMKEYFEKFYFQHIKHLSRDSRILEIGCGTGEMLGILRWFGFENVFGYDWPPIIVPKNSCDLIISQSVLEHQPKENIIIFLEYIEKTLKPGGMALIEVPSMDWLFAGHERYMDFTHEVGFTKDSLAQMMRQCFKDVEVFSLDRTDPGIKRNLSRAILNRLFLWADREGGSLDLWSRDIIAKGIKRE